MKRTTWQTVCKNCGYIIELNPGVRPPALPRSAAQVVGRVITVPRGTVECTTRSLRFTSKRTVFRLRARSVFGVLSNIGRRIWRPERRHVRIRTSAKLNELSKIIHRTEVL